jgi:hypothetical protein
MLLRRRREMTIEISKKIYGMVNKRGRIGTLSTTDANGQPDVACFGNPKLEDNGTLIVGLDRKRTLKNLKANPYAVLICMEKIKSGPVSFTTQGCRLYLKVRKIQPKGLRFKFGREKIARAAKRIVASISFDVTEVEAL